MGMLEGDQGIDTITTAFADFDKLTDDEKWEQLCKTSKYHPENAMFEDPDKKCKPFSHDADQEMSKKKTLIDKREEHYDSDVSEDPLKRKIPNKKFKD